MPPSFSSMDVGYDGRVGLTSGNSVFDLVDNGNDSVTLTFLQEVAEGTSSAVIGLKFGGQGDNQLGNFRFDAADFNRGTTLRFSWDPPFTGDGISHASVYANSVTPGGGGERPERRRFGARHVCPDAGRAGRRGLRLAPVPAALNRPEYPFKPMVPPMFRVNGCSLDGGVGR